MTSEIQLNRTFAALADPTRRKILARLASGEATVNDLAAPFNLTLPAISKHLKVLELAGLISRKKVAQKRPCQIETAPLESASAWIADTQKFWEESFDRLDSYLSTLQNKEQSKEQNYD